MRTFVYLLCWLVAVSPAAVAQHAHQHSPYAGLPSSGVASLSVEELESLTNGAGMGLARAGELNHYPGPKHVLELADSLRLTDQQRSQVEAMFESMLERARALGREIIDAERTLSRRFEHGHIDSATLDSLTGEIAQRMGRLRYTHLATHLALKDILTAEQVATYDRLRGYTSAM